MKKIKVKFVDFGTQYAFQILEQEGFPEEHNEGNVRILRFPEYNRSTDIFFIRGRLTYLDMNVVIKPYEDGENFQERVDHFLNALRNYMVNTSIITPVPGDMVSIKIGVEYFISRKLVTVLPKEYKNRYIIDIGEGNTTIVDKIYSNYKPIEQKIETSEYGITIITLTQKD